MNLYTNNKIKLAKTDLKQQLNRLSKEHMVDINRLVDNYFHDVKDTSIRYQEQMKDVMTIGVKKVQFRSYTIFIYPNVESGVKEIYQKYSTPI